MSTNDLTNTGLVAVRAYSSKNYTSVTVGGTTSELGISSDDLPANSLGFTKFTQVDYLCPMVVSTAAGAQTLTLRVYIKGLLLKTLTLSVAGGLSAQPCILGGIILPQAINSIDPPPHTATHITSLVTIASSEVSLDATDSATTAATLDDYQDGPVKLTAQWTSGSSSNTLTFQSLTTEAS